MTATRQRRRAKAERVDRCPDCGSVFHLGADTLADVEAAFLTWLEGHDCEVRDGR